MGKSILAVKYWRPAPPKKSIALAAILGVISVIPLIISCFAFFKQTELSSLSEKINEPIVSSSLIFTIYQATLTTIIVGLISPILAIFLLYAPNQLLKFSFLLRICSFCLPSIIIASGLILAWGNNGFLTGFLQGLMSENPLNQLLYSNYAVVFANVLMSAPLCSVLLCKQLIELPENQLKSVYLLNLSFAKTFSILFWPAMKLSLLYFMILSFLLSMGSFGALSILSSGPQSQTIEMAIYQAVYYEADWQLGGLLSVLHTLVCGAVTILALIAINRGKTGGHAAKINFSNTQLVKRCLEKHKWLNGPAICGTLMFDFLMISPILGIVFQAILFFANTGMTNTFDHILSSASVSLSYTVPAAAIITISAWLISRSYYRSITLGQNSYATLLQTAALASSIIPPMTLAFGALILQSWVDMYDVKTILKIFALSITLMPLAVSVLTPIYNSSLAGSFRVCSLLGLSEFTFFRRVELQTFRSSFLMIFSLMMALCLNETAITTMLGDPTSPALTTTMMRMMNQYRFGNSAVVACFLVVCTGVIVFYFQQSEGQNDA